MSNLPISSKYVSSPDKPVDAAEREAIVARVNTAYEAGGLDDLDYRRYLDIAFSARTLGQLRPVAEALPAPASYVTPANIESAPLAPGELSAARPPANKTVLTTVAVGAVALVLLLVALMILL